MEVIRQKKILFHEFLDKRIDIIVKKNNNKDIDIQIEILNDDDFKIIAKSLKNSKNINPKIKNEKGFTLGFNDNIEYSVYQNNEFKKTFIVFKFKLY